MERASLVLMVLLLTNSALGRPGKTFKSKDNTEDIRAAPQPPPPPPPPPTLPPIDFWDLPGFLPNELGKSTNTGSPTYGRYPGVGPPKNAPHKDQKRPVSEAKSTPVSRGGWSMSLPEKAPLLTQKSPVSEAKSTPVSRGGWSMSLPEKSPLLTQKTNTDASKSDQAGINLSPASKLELVGRILTNVQKTQQSDRRSSAVAKSEQAGRSMNPVPKSEQAGRSFGTVVKSEQADRTVDAVSKFEQAGRSRSDPSKPKQADRTVNAATKLEQDGRSFSDVSKSEQPGRSHDFGPPQFSELFGNPHTDWLRLMEPFVYWSTMAAINSVLRNLPQLQQHPPTIIEPDDADEDSNHRQTIIIIEPITDADETGDTAYDTDTDYDESESINNEDIEDSAFDTSEDRKEREEVENTAESGEENSTEQEENHNIEHDNYKNEQEGIHNIENTEQEHQSTDHDNHNSENENHNIEWEEIHKPEQHGQVTAEDENVQETGIGRRVPNLEEIIKQLDPSLFDKEDFDNFKRAISQFAMEPKHRNHDHKKPHQLRHENPTTDTYKQHKRPNTEKNLKPRISKNHDHSTIIGDSESPDIIKPLLRNTVDNKKIVNLLIYYPGSNDNENDHKEDDTRFTIDIQKPVKDKTKNIQDDSAKSIVLNEKEIIKNSNAHQYEISDEPRVIYYNTRTTSVEDENFSAVIRKSVTGLNKDGIKPENTKLEMDTMMKIKPVDRLSKTETMTIAITKEPKKDGPSSDVSNVELNNGKSKSKNEENTKLEMDSMIKTKPVESLIKTETMTTTKILETKEEQIKDGPSSDVSKLESNNKKTKSENEKNTKLEKSTESKVEVIKVDMNSIKKSESAEITKKVNSSTKTMQPMEILQKTTESLRNNKESNSKIEIETKVVEKETNNDEKPTTI